MAAGNHGDVLAEILSVYSKYNISALFWEGVATIPIQRGQNPGIQTNSVLQNVHTVAHKIINEDFKKRLGEGLKGNLKVADLLSLWFPAHLSLNSTKESIEAKLDQSEVPAVRLEAINTEDPLLVNRCTWISMTRNIQCVCTVNCKYFVPHYQ